MSRSRILSSLLLASTLALGACAPQEAEPEPKPAPEQEDRRTDEDRRPSSSASGSGSPSGTPVQAPEVNRLRIGISADSPGLGLIEDGDRPEGFDVEVARRIADRLEVSEREIDWVPLLPHERAQALRDGEVDLVAASFSMTENRQEQIDFAGPYLVADQDLLVRTEDSDEMDSLTDLRDRRVCVAEGSTALDAVEESAPDSTQMIQQHSLAECVVYLESGFVDAVAGDDMVLAGLVKDGELQETMELAGIEDAAFSTQRYGVGLASGSPLCPAVSETIQRLRESGQRDRLLQAATQDTGYRLDQELNSGEAAEPEPCP